MTVHLPAPWTGGKSSTATVEIYLPPGYDKGNARYPVFYEAPSTLGSWQNGMAFTTAMDGLMTSGYMPPAIVVFASTAGGPYVDAECADTFDGKEWFNRYMGDRRREMGRFEPSHDRDPGRSRTPLASRRAATARPRWLAIPNVFSTSVSMSGYFQAGIKSGTTPTAWRPFDNDPQQMSASSPIELVPALPASLRSHVMVIMEADPNNHFYGGQARTYATALDNAGVAMAVLLDPRGHRLGRCPAGHPRDDADRRAADDAARGVRREALNGRRGRTREREKNERAVPGRFSSNSKGVRSSSTT